MVFFDHNVNNGPENATQEAPPLSGKRNQRNRPLTPTGALFFFVLAVVSLRLVEPLLEALGLERLEPAVGTAIYAPFVILPLAYAFCPLVFTKRFWHFPRSSWKWICALAVLNALLLVLNRSQPVPVSKGSIIGIVLIVPLVEEVVTAVTISPLIERWGAVWAVLITGTLTTIVHPSPFAAAIPVFAQTIMFVATDRSIPATAIAHSLMNALIVAYIAWRSGVVG